MSFLSEPKAMIIAAVIGAAAIVVAALIALAGARGGSTNQCTADNSAQQHCTNTNTGTGKGSGR
ncbi:hypothetical protein [Streptomyces purpureus]|uniref:Uncharacterized protein n=1 Tax=Streptomyces purpureus TaxID=1951 RepID=A0A918HEF2_9ACTN|nr:hypothetical protein [Streptomyces purpureus]GGT58321.1 hypothetical protein GCM10014713_59960 [Streptomyces purpureus]